MFLEVTDLSIKARKHPAPRSGLVRITIDYPPTEHYDQLVRDALANLIRDPGHDAPAGSNSAQRDAA